MTTPFFLIDFENVQPKALSRLKPGQARVKVFLGQHQSKLMLDLVKVLQPFGADAEYIQIHGNGSNAADFHIAFYIGRLAAAHPGAAFHIISKDTGFDVLVKHLGTLGIPCRRLAEIPGGSQAKPASQAAAPAKPKPAKAVTVTVMPAASAPAKPAKPPPAATPTAAAPAKPAPPAPMAKPTATPPAKKATATSAAKSTAPGNTARARAKLVVEHIKKSTRPATLATLRSTIKACLTPAPEPKAIDAIIQSLRDSKKISVDGEKVSYALG